MIIMKWCTNSDERNICNGAQEVGVGIFINDDSPSGVV